ncbi:MAG: hypothetical protein QM523_00870 [Candidatus Pacebacteria bacterium]|nr:hypothetical protein [Candidatus Paceibacterota bacterium]
MTFLTIILATFGIHVLFVVLVICGNRKCFDRYPVQRRAQSDWLHEGFRE